MPVFRDCGENDFVDTRVKPRTSPLHRFLIALHSPTARLETRLRMCPPEKRRDGGPLPTGSPFSAVRFEDEILRNTGMFRAFCGNGRRTLSAVQTVWRRGRDSNPRYRC